MIKEAVYEYTDKDRADLAMTVTLVSFAMLFASLFLMYTVYRVTNTVWPPMGFERIPAVLPTISTFFIVLSSFSFLRFQSNYILGKNSKFYFAVTVSLSVAFLVTQNLLWNHLNATGVFVETGIFASILHAFTWIHAGHVVLGIMALMLCIPAMREKNKNVDYNIRISNCGKFWHFLGIVWIFMYIGIFLF